LVLVKTQERGREGDGHHPNQIDSPPPETLESHDHSIPLEISRSRRNPLKTGNPEERENENRKGGDFIREERKSIGSGGLRRSPVYDWLAISSPSTSLQTEHLIPFCQLSVLGLRALRREKAPRGEGEKKKGAIWVDVVALTSFHRASGYFLFSTLPFHSFPWWIFCVGGLGWRGEWSGLDRN
jgi:hypothetical protein